MKITRISWIIGYGGIIIVGILLLARPLLSLFLFPSWECPLRATFHTIGILPLPQSFSLNHRKNASSQTHGKNEREKKKSEREPIP